MRDLLEVVHDPDVEFNPYYGPAPEHDCPCGSGLQAQHCHRARGIVNTCGSGCFRRPPFRLIRPARAV
ncbi:SEC-C metal-binding domain-containing protein [Mycobacteroides abscessus]|uniref:SEC-C metal-binding domain-containing protein n=1 Tax=Mycobacteroides abscessus TaxID=36809 RepID=UPI000940B0CE|nr:SEC-C metal-binding domain-containing protein [Mycobacteroides abscessus]